MIKINLIGEGKRPAAVRKKRDLSSRINRDSIAFILLLVGIIPGLLAFAGQWWWLNRTLDARVTEVAEKEEEYRKLEPIIKRVEQFKKDNAELERKIKIIEDLKANQTGPVKVMDYVSRALPDLVWLDRMEVNRNRLRIRGRSRNENGVANFVENLDRVPEFEEPTLRNMRETRGGVYSFDLDVIFNVRPEQDNTAATAGATG